MSSFKQEVWGSVWLLLLLLLSQRFSKPTDNRFEGNTRMTSVTGNNRMVCRRTCFDCRLRSARWHSCYDLCLHVMCFYPTSTAEELGQSKYSLHTHTLIQTAGLKWWCHCCVIVLLTPGRPLVITLTSQAFSRGWPLSFSLSSNPEILSFIH